MELANAIFRKSISFNCTTELFRADRRVLSRQVGKLIQSITLYLTSVVKFWFLKLFKFNTLHISKTTKLSDGDGKGQFHSQISCRALDSTENLFLNAQQFQFGKEISFFRPIQ